MFGRGGVLTTITRGAISKDECYRDCVAGQYDGPEDCLQFARFATLAHTVTPLPSSAPTVLLAQ